MRARRIAFCRKCSTDTPQSYISTEQENVETWRCKVCRSTLVSLGDVPDADGFASSIAETWLRRQAIPTAGFVDREEVHAEARAALWAAFTKWDPLRGLPFRSYAAWKTASLLTDWIREQRGRTYGDDRSGLKPHADALSYDAPIDPGENTGDSFISRLEDAYAEGAGDPARDRSPDLARALSRRGRGDARHERVVGVPTDARVA